MPTTALNDRNPLINILRLGLLDREVQPVTGRDGSLDYGLTGRDISSLQRTCRAANDRLKMTPEAEVNTLARIVEPWQRVPVRPEGMRQAKLFMARIAQNTDIKPRDVCYAMAEMFSLSFQYVDSRSTPIERQTAIVFSAVMHAQDGPMTETGRVSRWVLHMRAQPNDAFRHYLERCGEQVLCDGAKVALGVGAAVGSFAAIRAAARATASASPTIRRLAYLSVPAWPFVAYFGVTSAIAVVPAAIGLSGIANDFGKEAMAFSQIDFYKDAVLFDGVVQANSRLLFAHTDQQHLALWDNREPRTAKAVGKQRLDNLRIFWGRHTGVY